MVGDAHAHRTSSLAAVRPRRRGREVPHQRAAARAETAGAQAVSPGVGYLARRFTPYEAEPGGEVTALREAGWRVHCFALEPVSDDTVTPLRDPMTRAVLLRALRAARMTPAAAALSTLLGDSRRSGRTRLWLDAATLLAHLDLHGLRHLHVFQADEAAEVARRAVILDMRRAQPRGITWSLTVPALDHLREAPEVSRRPRWPALAHRIHSAHGVVTSWQSDAATLVSMGSGRRVEVIPPGVDVGRFRPSPVTYRPSPESGEPLRVITVGPLVQSRGVQRVLHALPDVQRVHLTVVGEGPMQPQLQMLASELGVGERVTWFTSVRAEDLQAIYRGADALVVPAPPIGVPLSALEAMACGLPVVAPQTHGVRELVLDGESGVLLASLDPQDLARALRRMAHDITGHLTMGATARRHVEQRFSLSDQAAALSAFLSEVSGIPQPAGATPTRELTHAV